ncbi:MAG: PEP-CTERM sorting domain-containing protein [Planctomycetes bacterium]|nr:PEP-CTERM sorting domain-containing protein [Planctomycetota bacterium]
MNNSKLALSCAVLAVTLLCGTAQSAVITSWTFEASAGTSSPAVGTGSVSLVGGTTSTFATGFAGSGTWAFNTTTYAAQGTGDRTRGVQFTASTASYENIVVDFNIRHSNTAANTIVVQASSNGTVWNDVQVFSFTPAASGTGDTWHSRSVALDASYSNAASFGFRVVAAFAPGTAGYLAARSTSSYSTSGTMRYDDVVISGTLIPAPGSIALLGVAGLAGTRRRR